SSGTASDAEGNYALSVPSNATLVFSFIGYANQSVAVNNRTTINVTMAEDLTQLDEIVVVGYGTQEKRDVTGAIASISETQIKEIPVSSSVKVLQGRVAGVDIQQNGGRPGEGVTVRIRGRRSIAAGNDPLYVVDGIPLTSGIDDINPQDIKSIEVLKDAAATSIYGSRGANGVILITTNRGKAGKTVVSYDGYHGITSAVTTVDMMDGKEFYDLKRESRRFDPNTGALSFDGQLPDDITVFEEVELESISQNYRTTDYQDLILNNGYQTSHQLSVSGGSEKTTFMVSAGIFDEQGIIKTQDYVRNTIRLNLDHKINDIFSFGTSTLVAYTEQNWASNPLGEALSNNPLGYPYEADGVTLRFLPTNDGIRTNPLSEVVEGAYVEERKFTRIFNSLFLEIRPLEGLTFRSTFGPDYRNRRMGLFQGSYTNARRGGPSRADAEFNTDFAYTLENLLTYNKTLTEGHELKVTFLQSIQKSVEEDYSVSVTNLPYESQLFYNIGSTADITGWSSRYEGWQMASFMGRVNYDINGKYLFQASMRADGSSRLAAGNLWDYFPGVSAGWRIIEEAFMADQNMFSELKVRASYGKVGNTSIDPYQTLGRLRSTSYVFGSTPAFGFGLIEIPNTLLGWENTATTDIGVDFGVLEGRLSGTLDFYRAKTTDLLLPRQLPTTSGYTSVLQNVGVTRNTGLEIGLSAVPVDAASGFKW
ncbi:MAG: SusC/RagA family TonB-linked outer membrane protein, partial [Cyclobacteriaceae bacterium]|nr:SusC/RagA family TonB-linked outer membrane protein [Cyclobacteriaceae bacterium]